MTVKEVSFGATRLPIKQFKINEMVDHCTIAMIAKRATGKSFLTRLKSTIKNIYSKLYMVYNKKWIIFYYKY
jgi:hypothetical protein